ncbi:MAG: hypothetical protein H0X34_15095 [Chthoniobacterales bacterium]|nr:hypothetical protein [Chthoniobacterales bacterium]
MSFVCLVTIQTSRSESAIWSLSRTSGDWNTAANWTPATVPNGFSDAATFGFSNLHDISIEGFVIVRQITFTPAATTAYTITIQPTTLMFNNILTIRGNGIANNSGVTQNFVAKGNALGYYGSITFGDSATAGSETAFTTFGAAVAGEGGFGGFVTFESTTSAADGSFTNNGGLVAGGRGGAGKQISSMHLPPAIPP